MVQRPLVLLDCDPGHDDVFAIAVAAALTDLVAVTTVSGNAPIERTTHNALVASSVLGVDVPVHEGAARPLVVDAHHAPEIHGDSGLDGPVLPEPARQAEASTAVEAILEAARRHEALWIVATGPLTNVALALRSDASLATRIAGISLMGGGVAFGNVTPGAEFNIWEDPHAAAIVFGSGARIIVSPLDATHDVLVDDAYIHRVRGLESPAGSFLADLLSHFAQAYADAFFGEALGPLHDPCAVLTLTHPELFRFEELHVEIGTTSIARGMTVADRRGVKGTRPPNATVALGADGKGVLDVVAECIEALARR